MANKYPLFSEQLQIQSKEEKEWAERLLDRMAELAEGGPYEDEEGILKPENPAEAHAVSQGFVGCGWDLCYTVSDDCVWFYAEEGGDISYVGHFVQEYFKQWKPDGIFSLTYSETCSRPRVGEFGGGAMVVTANEIRYFNAYEWVQETVKNIRGG
ncbi:MAG: hypothetical protein GF334_02645 [Candidatus Altiarchaeales archaeon]|nr:hypothetical protein [Candidatus Altiarchaeales archaeon]